VGELINLQAYREKKAAEEIEKMLRQLEEFSELPTDPQPYWPLPSDAYLSTYFCSISDNTLHYYSDNEYFTDNDLWLWLRGDNNEELYPTEGIFGEDERDRT